MYVSHLANKGLALSSIKVYLSAIRNLHVEAGLHSEWENQLTPRLQLVLRGIKRAKASDPPTPARLPITIDIMRQIKAVLMKAPEKYDNILLWAACCLAFFGFLRCGEFTVPNQTGYDKDVHLSVNDIALDSRSFPTVVMVTIKQSKTDPFRQGVQLFLGKTGSDICPVSGILPFLAIRGSGQGPLFILKDRSLLTRQKFAALLSTTLSEAGIDDKRYATHSFRIGAATTAKEAGIADSQIKMLGRWKSNAYQIYIRTPQKDLAKLSKQLVSGSRN